jgi:hypothetical protein
MVNLISLSENAKEPALVTPWTIIHFIGGVLFSIFSKSVHFQKNKALITFFTLHAMYEIRDCYIYKPHNSIANSVGDQLFAVVGFILGWDLQTKDSLLVCLVLFLLFLSPITNKRGEWRWSNGLDSWSSRG